MPLENDFLPFATGGGANVESQTAWNSDSVVTTGFQTGIANSAEINKALRLCSLIAAMIAQFICNESGQPAVDNGSITTLLANFITSIQAVINAILASALGTGGTGYDPRFGYLQLTNIDNGASGGQLRLVQGNYGVMLRNDGSTLYLLFTPSGSPYGGWNGLRPLTINLATGAVTIDQTGAGTAFGGNISAPSASISGNETVTGALSAGSLLVTGGATLQSGATIDGNATVTGTISSNAINSTSAIFSTEAITGSLTSGSITATGAVSAGGGIAITGLDGSGVNLRIIGGSYGALLRNDGAAIYLLLTPAGGQTGGWNGLRPLTINLATGAVTIDQTGAGTAFGGNISANSAAFAGVSTSATPATGDRSTKIATTQSFANEFGSYLDQSGYQKLPSGYIEQWGITTISGAGDPVNFRIPFPIRCFGVVATDNGSVGINSSNSVGCAVTSLSGFTAYAKDTSGNPATTVIFWRAIGQ